MASTVTNSFDADKLHQPIVVAVKRVPRIPCNERRIEIQDKMTIGRRQYPRTLITQPKSTPVMLIRFRMAYIARQPSRPTPYM